MRLKVFGKVSERTTPKLWKLIGGRPPAQRVPIPCGLRTWESVSSQRAVEMAVSIAEWATCFVSRAIQPSTCNCFSGQSLLKKKLESLVDRI